MRAVNLSFRAQLVAALILPMIFLVEAVEVSAGVSFENIAADPASGLVYERVPSVTAATVQAVREASLLEPLTPASLAGLPSVPQGLPGVVVFDYDDDGDLDLYVTNGPGAANSLFENQLEAGTFTFVDVGAAAGVGAESQDSTGACAGDLDNDGDQDLLVLGRDEANRLFENLGNGSFVEVPGSGLSGGDLGSVGCTLGDVDGDGLLDAAVGNLFDFAAPPNPFDFMFEEIHPNQLFRNLGGLTFEDVSVISGIRELAALPPVAEGRTATWALALVDVDQDGDVDLVTADDQGPIPVAFRGGFDIGYVHVLLNDGTGHFSDTPVLTGPTSAGSWMGLSFGDLNCDGALDMLGSNFGDYGFSVLGLPYALEDQATRWLLGHGDGTFSDPGLGTSVSSVFGWGNAVQDFDNDGDQDLAYFGGMDLITLLLADNPGAILLNDGCSASFTVDSAALRGDYVARNVRGVASGDLDRDGFPDLVTASNLSVPPALPLVPMPVGYGTDFDATAFFTSVFIPTPDGLVWSGVDYGPGTVTVERNLGNTNGSISIETLGTVDITSLGRVNRDGIGAIVAATPGSGPEARVPVVAGSAHLSQHSLEAHFGLGGARTATVEVLWPGGVRNRLYRVQRGERLVFPEIPCSFDAPWGSFYQYFGCVHRSLHELTTAGFLDRRQKIQFLWSALRAFLEERR